MANEPAKKRTNRFPPWLRKRIPTGGEAARVRGMLAELGLATVCSGACCPNLPECYARGTATFLILGATCTRSCRFCAIEKAVPGPPRDDEPQAVAEACARLALRHVVITSVTRDDLADGGAGHFARTIRAVRERLPKTIIEVLTPDFQGRTDAIDAVLDARPDIFNHNVETVPRLYPTVRPEADYRRSLDVLAHAKRRGTSRTDTPHPAGVARSPDVGWPCGNSDNARSRNGAWPCHPVEPEGGCAIDAAGARHAVPPQQAIYTKSGLMVGLGETADEVRAVLGDLRAAGCDILTIGQYLAPSSAHLAVARFVEPAEFAAWEAEARALGFAAVASGPFVRSSYQAESVFLGRSQ
jgi:lipoic acid synthetase